MDELSSFEGNIDLRKGDKLLNSAVYFSSGKANQPFRSEFFNTERGHGTAEDNGALHVVKADIT